MKIIIFGTGLFYENRKNYFRDATIVAFLDNDLLKQGKLLDGSPIIAPREIETKQYNYVCIMSKKENQTEMENQLVRVGVQKENIITFQELQEIMKPKKMEIYYNSDTFRSTNEKDLYDSSCNKRILLISHELSRTGAPVVIFYTAMALKRQGYSVVVISPADGTLKEEMISNGISVIIDRNINCTNYFFLELLKQFDLVLVCALKMHFLVREMQKLDIPIIWWLHEYEMSYQAFGRDCLEGIDSQKIAIYAGGCRAYEAYKKYSNNGKVEELLYGVPDSNKYKRQVVTHGEKIVLAIIGTICYRKGQDILLDALQMLNYRELEKMDVRIIGADGIGEKGFADDIRKRAMKIQNVSVKGEIKLEELLKLYSDIDIIICTSREDPMPVVLAEAMMYYKTCIVTEATGTSSLIQNGTDGFVFPTGDAAKLAEAIRRILSAKDQLPIIGTKSRKIYENRFSMNVFEKNIMGVIESQLKH